MCCRYIKLSSPRLNNMAVVGCMLVYTAVILLGLDHATLPTKEAFPTVCTVSHCTFNHIIHMFLPLAKQIHLPFQLFHTRFNNMFTGEGVSSISWVLSSIWLHVHKDVPSPQNIYKKCEWGRQKQGQ